MTKKNEMFSAQIPHLLIQTFKTIVPKTKEIEICRDPNLKSKMELIKNNGVALEEAPAIENVFLLAFGDGYDLPQVETLS